MKNNFKILTFILIINIFVSFNTNSNEVFNFDVTEGEIINNGNIFLGKKGGTATAEDGTTITADNFKYNKLLNTLYAEGNVKINDVINDVQIFTDDITYQKNDEFIFTKNRTKATDGITTIVGNEFSYKKKLNIINAQGDVVINDTQKDYIIKAENITYEKKSEKIYTKGITEALVHSKYKFTSFDVLLLKNEMKLISNNRSTVKDDNFTFYKLDKFSYLINEELLKGKNIITITNYLKPKSDKIFFKSGIFNFSKKKFFSKDTVILLHKTLFDSERFVDSDLTDENKKKAEKFKGQNDPRILGVSSSGNENKTIINKGVFTSCKKNDNCSPWHIKAEKITHDKTNKNIHYKNAVLNIFDTPVFYFPSFFHPDPSVDRRSGLLQPVLNKSNIVGTSVTQPYFHVISRNKDYTFKPTIFDDRIIMLQNEYRQSNKNSQFIADFGYTKGYQSSLSNNRNSMSHIFSKANIDLDLEEFDNSKLDIFLEKVSMDTYLKIFEDVLLTDKTFENDLKDHNRLTSGLKLSLDHEDYTFTSGITSYENLQAKNNDRYEYVFPYYNFSTNLFSNFYGSLAFNSNGNNTLSETNKLESKINNDFNFSSRNKYSKYGFVSNYNFYLKNLNSIGKKNSNFKSSPDLELFNINEFLLTYPLEKNNSKNKDYLTPKISFRINPSDMKDQSNDSRLITTDNIFGINRLGLTDSYESGKSLTLGLDYRKENKDNAEKYLEVKFATVLRDVPEYKIPRSSSIYNESSNLFGSIENKFSDFLTVDYNFAIDNDLNTFEYNSFNTIFTYNNFVTELKFQESNSETGDSNYLENKTSINFNDNNSLIFSTRRNRKISLTEFYDFVYEYQNDCMTAAIKYKKTYYSDRDAIPKEDLFFTITLFPLTTIDQKIDKKLYRDDNNDIIWK